MFKKIVPAINVLKNNSILKNISTEKIILLSGSEPFFIRRITDLLSKEKLLIDDDLEIINLSADLYEKNKIFEIISPSLFSNSKLLIVERASYMNDIFLEDILHYLEYPDKNIQIIIQHDGNNRGKKFLDKLSYLKSFKIDCAKLNREYHRIDFISNEFKISGKNITSDAAKKLLTVLNNDLSDIAAACSQLISDVEGNINAEKVENYYRGKDGSASYKIADAVVAGNISDALKYAQYAKADNVDPNIIIFVLAGKFRNLAKACSALGGNKGEILNIPKWQMEKINNELKIWNMEKISLAIIKISEIDVASKGGRSNPRYEIDKAVIYIASLVK